MSVNAYNPHSERVPAHISQIPSYLIYGIHLIGIFLITSSFIPSIHSIAAITIASIGNAFIIFSLILEIRNCYSRKMKKDFKETIDPGVLKVLKDSFEETISCNMAIAQIAQNPFTQRDCSQDLINKNSKYLSLRIIHMIRKMQCTDSYQILMQACQSQIAGQKQFDLNEYSQFVEQYLDLEKHFYSWQNKPNLAFMIQIIDLAKNLSKISLISREKAKNPACNLGFYYQVLTTTYRAWQILIRAEENYEKDINSINFSVMEKEMQKCADEARSSLSQILPM